MNNTDSKSHLGFIADDWFDAKMPKEWDNIIYKNEKDSKLMSYNKTTVILGDAVGEMAKEITNSKTEITKSKNSSR